MLSNFLYEENFTMSSYDFCLVKMMRKDEIKTMWVFPFDLNWMSKVDYLGL